MGTLDIDLSIKISKYIHDNCDNVPHDIGLKILEIIIKEKTTFHDVEQFYKDE